MFFADSNEMLIHFTFSPFPSNTLLGVSPMHKYEHKHVQLLCYLIDCSQVGLQKVNVQQICVFEIMNPQVFWCYLAFYNLFFQK